ncbi:hypothetical protein [Candidatus Vidania fulgoroideorum]
MGIYEGYGKIYKNIYICKPFIKEKEGSGGKGKEDRGYIRNIDIKNLDKEGD